MPKSAWTHRGKRSSSCEVMPCQAWRHVREGLHMEEKLW